MLTMHHVLYQGCADIDLAATDAYNLAQNKKGWSTVTVAAFSLDCIDDVTCYGICALFIFDKMIVTMTQHSSQETQELWKLGENVAKIPILGMAKNGKIHDFRRNFSQNLHFLMNEKWHFYGQNPLEPSNDKIDLPQAAVVIEVQLNTLGLA